MLKRKGFNKPIDKRKLFKSNANMIFEDDFAPAHTTNVNEDFKQKNFPNHTPVLHRFRGKHPVYFGAKFDDFWWIERLWAIMGTEVYREPRVWTVKKLMRRVREPSKNIDQRTLIKLEHQSPAKMNEIYRFERKANPTFIRSKEGQICMQMQRVFELNEN